jgi:hypothetical protein
LYYEKQLITNANAQLNLICDTRLLLSTLDDFSFSEDIESDTQWIEETLANILNQKTRRIRLCARSIRWWNDTFDAKRKAVSQAKRRQHESGGADRLRASRNGMKTEIGNAKREMWQNFLSNSQRDDVWRALEFTKPAMNMALPALRDESGNTATSIEEKRQMLMAHAFPLPPSDPCDDDIFKPAGHFHKSISREIIAASIWGQASKKSPGPDGIGHAALKLFGAGTLNG